MLPPVGSIKHDRAAAGQALCRRAASEAAVLPRAVPWPMLMLLAIGVDAC